MEKKKNKGNPGGGSITPERVQEPTSETNSVGEKGGADLGTASKEHRTIGQPRKDVSAHRSHRHALVGWLVQGRSIYYSSMICFGRIRSSGFGSRFPFPTPRKCDRLQRKRDGRGDGWMGGWGHLATLSFSPRKRKEKEGEKRNPRCKVHPWLQSTEYIWSKVVPSGITYLLFGCIPRISLSFLR